MLANTAEEKGDHAAIIYGTHFPNRLFVGCLPPKATADDIGKFFSSFGKVIEAKVVLDDQGRSRRFGFVSFSKAVEAERVLNQGSIYLLGKKINVGPAVRKEVINSSEEDQAATQGNDLPPQVPVRIVTTTPADIPKHSSPRVSSSCAPRYRYTFTTPPPTPPQVISMSTRQYPQTTPTNVLPVQPSQLNVQSSQLNMQSSQLNVQPSQLNVQSNQLNGHHNNMNYHIQPHHVTYPFLQQPIYFIPSY